MRIEVNGADIHTEQDFHAQIVRALSIQGFYGFNLDALWDLLSAGVERPLILIWKNSDASKKDLGDCFERILEVLDRVKFQDESFGWENRFSYTLD